MSPSRTKSASGYSHVNKKDSAAEGTEAEKWLRKGHAACLRKKIKMKSLAVSPSLLTQRENSPEKHNKNLLTVIALMLPTNQGCFAPINS